MATLNKKTKTTIRTHEDAPASRINAEQQLRRSLMSCLLWENEFYEDGQTIAERLCALTEKVDTDKAAKMMIEARSQMYLRHAPLLIASELAKEGRLKANDLDTIIQRADELTEFLAIYWRNGHCKLANAVKKGLAKAFPKFDAYSLAKYNRDKDIKLRDVMFLTHPKPKNKEQAQIWKKLIDGTLESPDTWEVELSTKKGKDKKQSWTRLLEEKKIDNLSLLRNLRNLKEAGVDSGIVKERILTMNVNKILPFRFIAAARYAPQWESTIEKAMFRCMKDQSKLKGKTVVLVDVSGSMNDMLSTKSDMTRMDAACGVAICGRELCEDVEIYSFSDRCVQIPDRHGFALRDAIVRSQLNNSTCLGAAVKQLNEMTYDRIIVITDEQSHDTVPAPKSKGYMINVASNQNGVGYGKWTHIDGWSDSVLRYITEIENSSV